MLFEFVQFNHQSSRGNLTSTDATTANFGKRQVMGTQVEVEFDALVGGLRRHRDAQPSENMASSRWANMDLVGQWLHCYVPRRVRELTVHQFLASSFSDIAVLAADQKWIIDDVMHLVRRWYDECGLQPESPAADRAGDTLKDDLGPVAWAKEHQEVCEPAQTVDTLKPNVEPDQTDHLPPPSPIALAELQERFEAAREVLASHVEHAMLNEELREFLEPNDVKIPRYLLWTPVRSVLETPFSRLARQTAVGRSLECVVAILERAVATIRSHSGYRDENVVTPPQGLRSNRHMKLVPRDLDISGNAWRCWCEAIQPHADAMKAKLGTVASCLANLSSGFWHLTFDEFCGLTLSEACQRPAIGPKKLDEIASVVRDLAVSLSGIDPSDAVGLRLVLTPFHRVERWMEDILESASAPTGEELAARLLQPLAEQVRRDLDERTVDIAFKRFGLNGLSVRPTLEDLAAEWSVTRERIRQIEMQAQEVLQLRWPRGRVLLERLLSRLQESDESRTQIQLVHKILSRCFASTVELESLSASLNEAWSSAGRKKLTPMTLEQIERWGAENFSNTAPAVIRNQITNRAAYCDTAAGHLWFSDSELDQILLRLYECGQPTQLRELISQVVNQADVPANAVETQLKNQEERNLRHRIQRDPRFVELDDDSLVPADQAGFVRLEDVWHVRLEAVTGSTPIAQQTISVLAIAEITVAGMLRIGVVDATVWGVHRFVNESLQNIYGVRLPSSVSPFVLADKLVLLSEPLIQTMRRRRLRWDSRKEGPQAIGKRGWVGNVVEEVGQPVVLRELEGLLRRYYQDYADYVVKQIYSAMDEEDGLPDYRVTFLTDLGHSVPVIAVPTNWQLDDAQNNVSEGVLKVAGRLARQLQDRSFAPQRRLRLDELNSVPWLKQLVERLAASGVDGAADNEVEDESDTSSALLEVPQPNVVLTAEECLKEITQVAAMHRSEDPYQVFDADLKQSCEKLLNYAFWRIKTLTPEWAPWSITELALTNEDYQWLSALMSRATQHDVKRFLSGVNLFAETSKLAQLGAVWLTFDAELARRFAVSGNLWDSLIRRLPESRGLRNLLFAGSRPTALHRQALEAAANELHLRCAFGDDSAQEWYQLIYLQIGFSRPSFERRLPEWLAGQNRLVSIERLLDDSRFASDSFRELWKALQDYRDGHASRQTLKEKLDESPWVLDEWHDSLIERCRAPIEALEVPSPFVGEDESLTDDVTSPEIASEGELLFLTTPQLQFDNDGVCFKTTVQTIDASALSEDVYDVWLNGNFATRLMRQADASYGSTETSLRVPHDSATALAVLKSRSGEVVATQALVLWDDGEDVDGYVVKTGRRVSPWLREFADREVFLIYAADLAIEPQHEAVAVIGSGRRNVVHLNSAGCRETKLRLDGEVLWEPVVRAVPEWRERVDVGLEFRPPTMPREYRFKVSHPRSVEPTAWRSKRELHEWKRQDSNATGLHFSEWMPLDREVKNAGKVSLTVLLRSGDETTELRRVLPLQLPGHLWKREGCWDCVRRSATVSAAEIKSALFRLAPPESDEEWHVFEGRFWCCRVETGRNRQQWRGQRIDDLIARGAPLVLRTGPYNSTDGEDRLLQGVVDYGLLTDVKWDRDGTVEIVLAQAIEPALEHQLVALTADGRVVEWGAVTVGLAESQDGAAMSRWVVRAPEVEATTHFVAVALAFERTWLGCWWREEWSDCLKLQATSCEHADRQDVVALADAIRWFRLPLLANAARSAVNEFVSAHAADVIPAWLSDSSPNEFVYEIGERSKWNIVLKSFLGDWSPTPQMAAELDRRLDETSSDRSAVRLETATKALLEVDGLLAARFVRAGVQSDEFRADPRQTKALFGGLKQRLLNGEKLDDLTNRVAQGVARTGNPPEGTMDFIRDALLGNVFRLLEGDATLEEFNLRNIEVAMMRLEAFRRLVLVTCLERFGSGK